MSVGLIAMKLYTAISLRFISTLLLGSVLVGCVSSPMDSAVELFQNGEGELALAELEDPEGIIGDENKLLQLMHQGLISHHEQKYVDAQGYLLEAATLIEEQEQVRLSEIATTLITTESMGSYKGEYVERLWVHSYLMMNFLVQGDAEGAAVEARRALKVLSKHEDVLEDAVFTRALVALSFEAAGQKDDARIEFDILKESLADDKHNPLFELLPSEGAELVLFVAEGNIAEKYSSDLFISTKMHISWPSYARESVIYHEPALVYDSGRVQKISSVTSNLTSLASESLAKRGMKISLKTIARVGVKSAIIDQAEEADPLAGAIVQLLVFALDTADVRGWDSLPAYLSIYKVPLTSGYHQIEVVEASLLVNADPTVHEPIATYPNLFISAGERIFKSLRY